MNDLDTIRHKRLHAFLSAMRRDASLTTREPAALPGMAKARPVTVPTDPGKGPRGPLAYGPYNVETRAGGTSTGQDCSVSSYAEQPLNEADQVITDQSTLGGENAAEQPQRQPSC
jgi:hypothetical protein